MNNKQLFAENWQTCLFRIKDRLEIPIQWYPFPAMIGFMLVMILGGHLLTDLNPRLGARVQVIPLESDRLPDGGIWLGVYEKDEEIHVITSDRKKFSWAQNSVDIENFEPLIRYLKLKTLEEAESTVIKMKSSAITSRAVIAVDQHLKYVHLRPILYSLAKANISRYGFETRIIN
ncbi:MAG: hypothetical protein HRU19_14630 [Pseudobacteriovorax sp.]|nr:hypothetical protein [Pseudobacteriovorax sp.]